ncbi:MAG: DNA polymerase III subunit alpha [Acidobacteriota bacterium]|nr:DNA polymerase III subunit alpha [Acidobacteriota bacterium]
MAPRFIHLHNHSEYSILDGAIRVENLPEAAKRHGMGAVALTDHGNIFGAVAFAKAAKKAGIKPIFGSEVYLAPHSRFDREVREHETAHFHLLLLVRDEIGYHNLCILLSKAYLEGFYYRPRVDKELLAAHSRGLIALSACLKGEVAYLLARDMDEEAARAAGEYADIFGRDAFYIELMDHGLEPQKKVNPKLVRLARSLGLPLAASNDCHYQEKEDAESHDALLCIQTNKKVSDPDRIKFGSQEFYFKSGDEMAGLFAELPEALTNTFEIAARCDFSFPKDVHFLPRFDPPDGRSLQEYFETVSRQGFETRMEPIRPRLAPIGAAHTEVEYKERFERELKLIEQMKFEGYFLIVWDLLRTARAKDIPVGPGRGSAAGSLLAYCLGITDIDPIEYDLLFERFLNPERVSLPDIDMDFCARRREEMIRYVHERYGEDNVSQIITFGTMAARAAIRDVGRVLEVPLPEVDRIAKMIPFAPGQEVTIATALKDVPALRELRDRNSKVAHLLALAQKVEGQVRNPSIHAAGVVITPRPLTEFVPLYRSSKGEVTTQFAMGDVEAVGLLKMDFLGLRNLTIIRDALDIIERDTGERPDVDKLPLDDAKTFALFQAGATDGVFQFESRGMKELLRSYRPEEFRDLIALNALYRPGPLKSGMTTDFVTRKHHPEQIVYDIPALEPILKETRGLIVYQEQVMRIAVVLAGFSMAQADVLRKAMGKKDKDLMRRQKEQFLAGVKATKSVAAAKAAKLFEQIQKFAEYCFNKSHSAAYAVLAFQTAWLKAHYPRHFMAALISSEAERGATAQVVKYIAECKAMGIEVLPPDINASDFSFTVKGSEIRFGLSAVKNVGETAARAMVELRRERGEFTGPFDVVRDADSRIVTRRVLESLIKAGAFDCLGLHRSQNFHLVEDMIRFNHEIQRGRASLQTSLFGGEAEAPAVPEEIRAMPEWDEPLMLSYEKEALGFYITGHPLAEFESTLRRLVTHFVADLDEERDFGSEVVLAGIIQDLKNLKNKKDERMASFSLEDMTGRIEVVAFPDAFKKNYEFIREDLKVWLKGKFLGEGDSRKVQLLAIMQLDDALQKMARRVVLRVFLPGLEPAILEDLQEILAKYTGDCPLFFDLETPLSRRVTTQSPDFKGLTPSPSAVKALEALLGDGTVVVDY